MSAENTKSLKYQSRKYATGVGTVDEGREYEYKIPAFMALQQCMDQDNEDFEMASNVEDCIPFDDLIVRKKNYGEDVKTLMFQMKHQSKPSNITFNELCSQKGDFSLTKYYLGYKKLLEVIDNKLSNQGIVQDMFGHVDDVYLILFTNRGVSGEFGFLREYNNSILSSLTTTEGIFYNIDCKTFLEEYKIISNIVFSVSDMKQFDKKLKSFKTLTGYHYQYLINLRKVYKDDYKNLKIEVQNKLQLFTEPLYALFLNKLILFCGQQNQSNVEELIVNKLNYFCTNEHNVTAITKNFLKYLNVWVVSAEPCTMTKTLITNKLIELLLEPFISTHYSNVCQYQNVIKTGTWNNILKNQNITLIDKDEVVDNFILNYLYDKINKRCNINIFSMNYINTWTTNLSSEDKLRILKRLERTGIDFEIRRLVGVTGNITLLDIYKSLWLVGEIPLVLRANNVREYETIFHVLQQTKCTLGVVIVRDKFEGESCRPINTHVFAALSDLNDELREIILTENIRLQNKSLQLKALYDVNSVMDKISVKYIIYILVNEFCVGNVPNALPTFYIPQTVSKIIVNPTALILCREDVFIIHCSGKNSFEKYLQKYNINIDNLHLADYTTENNYSDYKIILMLMDICCDFIFSGSSKPTHELQLNENEMVLELVRTERGIGRIKEMTTKSNVNISSTNLISYFKNKLSVISAGPGMGKSTLMDYVAHNTPSDVWVLTVDLKMHLDYYSCKEFKTHHLDPSQHLIYFNNTILSRDSCDNEINKLVFNNFLTCNRVLVILDGFDEIATTYEPEVTDMIRSLYDNNYKMVLTTRPVMETYLEENFNTLSIALNPFSKEDQILFLNKYFTQIIDNWTAKRLKRMEEFVNKLLRCTEKNLSDWDNEFTGVPLQCKLLGEVFSSDCKSFIETGKLELNENFDLLYLYESFICSKVDILKNKYGHYTIELRDLVKEYQLLHALKIIFPKELLSEVGVEMKLPYLNKMFKNLIQVAQKDGLMVVKDEFNVNFVHRTFAEYISAKWLTENFKGGEHKDVAISLIKITLDPKYNVVHNIFDRILARGHPLHVAAINRSNKIKSIIKSNPDIVYETDSGGRSALHVVASWGDRHTIPKEGTNMFTQSYVFNKFMGDTARLLLDNGVKHDRDMVLGYYPMDYALSTNSLQVADVIARKFNNLSVIVDDDNVIPFVYYCCTQGYKFLCKFINDLGCYNEIIKSKINDKITSFGSALLQMTTFYGHTEILTTLLSQGAKVNLKDDYELTPLYVAATSGNLSAVKLLVAHGADINLTDNKGLTPLQAATSESVVEYLKSISTDEM